MTATESNPVDRLQALIACVPEDPAALAADLAAARREVARCHGLEEAQARAELQFLEQQAAEPAAATAIGPTLAGLRARLVARRCRRWQQADAADPGALFALAELRAECRHLGLVEQVAECDAAIARRVAAVAAGEALHQEATERYAALQTDEEDLALGHKVLLLRSTADLLADLARATGDRRLRPLARRLRAAASDRELALRIERLLGRRGAAWLERTSFVLLLLVLGIVLLDFSVELPAARRHDLLWADALICSFFLGEFTFKLALVRDRLGWFLRNAVTDLLPAIPAVLFLLPTPPALGDAGDVVALRALRLFRITWAARYVQALRPVLRLFRLLLLLIRGLDGLVQRFSPLLNRNFVFFEAGMARAPSAAAAAIDPRGLAFAALRREHALLRDLPPPARQEQLRGRCAWLGQWAATAPPAEPGPAQTGVSQRDIAVDEAVERLWRLQPEDVEQHLSASDLSALDRVVRVLSAPVVRWLPVARRLCVRPLPATPQERVVALGRRVAAWLEAWQHRLTFLADLHGIMTGPQILDRVASAMVRVSQRPAFRLLLFGGLFVLLDALVGETCLKPVAKVLERIVGWPLVILGSVCLVFLTLGWWLKRIAGEAADSFRLTSEAHFAGLLDLVKRRHEPGDLQFLAGRVFGRELSVGTAATLLQRQVQCLRRGDGDGPDCPPLLRQELMRVALLYLHFLDGAVLHEDDQKTTEQLLANLSLENLRSGHLGFSPRDRKRLRRLRLDDGSLVSGPYLWFRFITESVTVEAAKRIAEYNRRCLTLTQQAAAAPEELAAMRQWLATRRDAARGRTLERTEPTGTGAVCRNTEFNALDFLAADPERDAWLRGLFGDEVADTVRIDRRHMIRQVFGTRPLHHLPRSQRSFNAYRFYWRRLSFGRVFLVPVFSLWQVLRSMGWMVGKLGRMVREILTPALAMQRRENGEAPFAVALRKIHRMKAPGLLEAMHTRVRLDPAYCGAPGPWLEPEAVGRPPELERDLDWLQVRERDRAELRQLAEQVQERAGEWLVTAGELATVRELRQRLDDPAERAVAELCWTVAWISDCDGLRSLSRSQRWLTEELPRLVAEPSADGWCAALVRQLAGLLRPHPVDRWLARTDVALRLPRRERRRLRAAHAAGIGETRSVIDAWNALPPHGMPAQRADDILRRAFHERDACRRDLAALRAIQSLSVLDVRNYRDLVFRLGDYAAEGEDPALATALP